MQAVGKFDEDDTDVIAHSQKGLAQRFVGKIFAAVTTHRGIEQCFLVVFFFFWDLTEHLGVVLVSARDTRQVGQLGNAIHQLSYFIAELSAKVDQGNGRIFYGIVEQTSGHYSRLDAHLSQNDGHSDAVSDVGLPRSSFLFFMRFFCVAVGVHDGLSINHRIAFG
ncbi:hypothetical protein SDC9_97038 [bioreactor metagenome]|uniref:Uncharacterized protein n=1 Tax=bioreactor metagenome TaxID=1076179 RepID=A0A645AAQ0_9ZZZZ